MGRLNANTSQSIQFQPPYTIFIAL